MAATTETLTKTQERIDKQEHFQAFLIVVNFVFAFLISLHICSLCLALNSPWLEFVLVYLCALGFLLVFLLWQPCYLEVFLIYTSYILFSVLIILPLIWLFLLLLLFLLIILKPEHFSSILVQILLQDLLMLEPQVC